MIHSENGFFNEFGGKYVAEVLRRPLDELEVAFKEAVKKVTFCIPEYRYELGERYKVLIKYLGNRDETYIMMVIFIDISEYV